MSNALVISHADQIELMHGTGAVFSLRLDNCDGEQRRALIDHHGRVMALLRRRRHQVRGGLVHDDLDGECLTLRIVSRDAQSVERRHGLA